MCIWSLSYSALSAHVSYCRLWPAPLYYIFPHYLLNGTIFEKKKLLNTKRVFWFSVHLLFEIFPILRRYEWDVIIHVHRSSCKVPVILARFEWNFIFSRQIFEKYSNIKFHENLAVGAELFRAVGQKDRQAWRSQQSLLEILRLCLKTNQLIMLYWEIIAVCSEIHTKHITLIINTQSVPRSKHTPSQSYKPVS